MPVYYRKDEEKPLTYKAYAGYFFDILQPEDWVRTLETGSLGSHGEALQQVVGRDSDFEEPVIVRYKVRTNGR